MHPARSTFELAFAVKGPLQVRLIDSTRNRLGLKPQRQPDWTTDVAGDALLCQRPTPTAYPHARTPMFEPCTRSSEPHHHRAFPEQPSSKGLRAFRSNPLFRRITRRLTGQLVRSSSLYYPGRTMVQKRAGKTVKVSVSLDRSDLAALRRRAGESYGGNLSAAFAEAARWIRQREARQRLIEQLGGPTLTRRSRESIDAEQTVAGRRRKKSRGVAA